MVGLLYTLVLWRVVAKSVLSFGFNFPWKLRPQPSYGFVPAKRATGPCPPLAIGPHSEPRKLNFCSWRNETWAQYSGGPNNKQCQAPLVARCSSRRNIIDWSSYSILALIYFMNVWILSSEYLLFNSFGNENLSFQRNTLRETVAFLQIPFLKKYS